MYDKIHYNLKKKKKETVKKKKKKRTALLGQKLQGSILYHIIATRLD